MKVFVAGLRGVPDIQGGVETHAKELYPLLSELGYEVTLAVRPWCYPTGIPKFWQGIRLLPVWSPTTSGVEAFVHNILAVLCAAVRRPDIVHLHAVGAGYAVACARALGLRVVFTHHGPDYEREKWGPVARLVLRLGEFLAVRYANQVILVSHSIAAQLERNSVRPRLPGTVIWNGVRPRELHQDETTLPRFGLTAGRYVLQVSRLVPEKRQLDLIEAFAAAALPGWQLVLVGALDGQPYARTVSARAATVPGVILTDFQTGTALNTLYANAGIFVLPSSLEGLPIALLEALSQGLPVIASDIEANREIGLPARHYFAPGNIESLRVRLCEFAADSPDAARADSVRERVLEQFSWSSAAHATAKVYETAMASGRWFLRESSAR